ncbi:class I SAM-dependent methyltransferase [Enterobacter asburiae]
MLLQTVKNYQFIHGEKMSGGKVAGTSASPRRLIFDIPVDKAAAISVLDIGFGSGGLGSMIRDCSETQHWVVDGIDGFAPNCFNPRLVSDRLYRNVWHGLAQDLPADTPGGYDIICLLDVIEHLPADAAKQLMTHLFSSMREDAFLFVSTPLWFYPQDNQQDGDLEAHLIGIPATSMMGMMPLMYAVSPPLVGGFVYQKDSLHYIDLFCPVTDRSFTYERGMDVARAINCHTSPGVTYKINHEERPEAHR